MEAALLDTAVSEHAIMPTQVNPVHLIHDTVQHTANHSAINRTSLNENTPHSGMLWRLRHPSLPISMQRWKMQHNYYSPRFR